MTKEEFKKIKRVAADVEYFDAMCNLNKKFEERIRQMVIDIHVGDEIEMEISLCKRDPTRMPGDSDRKTTAVMFTGGLSDAMCLLETMRQKTVGRLNDASETFSKL